MLIDEALMAVRIRHPNVVWVEELGEENGVCFLVMEYVDGWSLGQLLDALQQQGRRMTVELAVHVAAGVAAALHAAHEARHADGRPLELVHRDVSPPNVLLSRDGNLKLIDFGVAKALGRGIRTTAGTVKGKFRYMSPEQAKGKPVDRRTDVYAVGILLWEMLAMWPLFDADDELELLVQVREPTHRPPSELADGVPAELDRAVLAALAPAPEDRPATAQDLRRAILRALPEAAVVDSADLAALLDDVMSAAHEDRDGDSTSPARPSARPPGAMGLAELTIKADLSRRGGGSR